jgi:hypothetical protein
MGTSMVPQTPIVKIPQSSSNPYSNVGPSKVLINYQKEDKISLSYVCEIDPYLYLLSPEFAIQGEKTAIKWFMGL